MNCLPCFKDKSDSEENDQQLPVAQAKEAGAPLLPSAGKDNGENDIEARAFTFREMATATKNFRKDCVLYDDGFARVFKGTLQPSGQVVAIKQLDRNGKKEANEFLAEVATLSPLKHPNLINLIGYCADGEQRILVYEYLKLGSLESHLLDRPADRSPLDWVTRMKIASGAAEGLEYLHEKAKPPVIYRDFKSSKILLDDDYNPRLCDFGLGKLAENGSTAASVPPRVMGTYGYSAPEYARSGELTLKSDIYSFGVVLLELITGRRAIDPNRPANEQNLVTWAQPIFRDPKRFPEMADPLLNNNFSVKSLNQAVGVAAMCLQEEPTVRPYITDVLAALSFLDFNSNDAQPSSDKESVKDADKGDHESDSSSSDSEKDENDNNQNGKSSDHEHNGNNNHEDNADTSKNRNSSSDSGDEKFDDAQQGDRTKSIKSTKSKKGKTVELSDDESLYSAGSSRSSSNSINEELEEKKTTPQKVKSHRRLSIGKSTSKKIKNRWRRAKVAIKKS